jgi:hypothetical protein
MTTRKKAKKVSKQKYVRKDRKPPEYYEALARRGIAKTGPKSKFVKAKNESYCNCLQCQDWIIQWREVHHAVFEKYRSNLIWFDFARKDCQAFLADFTKKDIVDIEDVDVKLLADKHKNHIKPCCGALLNLRECAIDPVDYEVKMAKPRQELREKNEVSNSNQDKRSLLLVKVPKFSIKVLIALVFSGLTQTRIGT